MDGSVGALPAPVGVVGLSRFDAILNYRSPPNLNDTPYSQYHNIDSTLDPALVGNSQCVEDKAAGTPSHPIQVSIEEVSDQEHSP